MKTSLKHLAAILPLFTAVYAFAADDAAPADRPLPVVTVQAVTTADPSGYAMWVGKGNENFKAGGGPERFTHVYQGVVAGEETGAVFAVRFADSAVALAKQSAALMKISTNSEIMGHLAQIRKLGAASMLKAVYSEGGYDQEWLYITDAQVKDEGAYVKALGELRTLLDGHGLKDIKLNVFRVISGRSNHSHEVMLSAPSEERNAALMDFVSGPDTANWLASVASLRTVVANGIYKEISK